MNNAKEVKRIRTTIIILLPPPPPPPPPPPIAITVVSDLV